VFTVMMLDVTRSEFAVMLHDSFQFPIYKRLFRRYKFVVGVKIGLFFQENSIDLG